MSALAMSEPSPGSLPHADSMEFSETSGRALKFQTDAPHLVSMGGGRLSTSVTLHPLPPGRITIGSSPGVDILVQGTGVQPIHCHIENDDGIVMLYPLSENLSIDGVKVAGPTRLSQGVMLTIGRSNYLRFNHPAEAKLMKQLLPTPRISMAPIQFEVDNIQASKMNKKPPVVPRKNSRESLSDSSGDEPPSSIMTKVSKFEYLAAQNLKKAISPKVFSSNLVTVTIPAKHVLGNAPPDLQSLTKNLPQSALNYSELNYNINQKNKTPDRQIFGKKSPQYVNVSLDETKPINQRVILFENSGKTHNNENLHINNLNNANVKNSTPNKMVNLNCNIQVPSPGYNRNPTFTNQTPTSSSNNINMDQKSTSSVGDYAHRKNEAEIRRNQAQVDRIKEQEIEKAEQARLEEILNMCAEYEKSQTEKNKLTPNRIKTNGSLPRDKRPGVQNGTPSPQINDQVFRFETEHISQFSNMPQRQAENHNYENVSLRTPDVICEPLTGLETNQQNNIPHILHSPRTRIKTFVTSKESPTTPKDTSEVIESKFASADVEHSLLSNKSNAYENFKPVASTPTVLKPSVPGQNVSISSCVRSLDNYENVKISYGKVINNDLKNNDTPARESWLSKSRSEFEKIKIESLKFQKRDKLLAIANFKQKLAEYEKENEQMCNLETVLIEAEIQTKDTCIDDLEARKEELSNKAKLVEEQLKITQESQEKQQNDCKNRLDEAQKHVQTLEKSLASAAKGTPEYDNLFEEYLTAQEVLDNERKTFEDLEFHYLENEANALATREEIQREIIELSKRIENTREESMNLSMDLSHFQVEGGGKIDEFEKQEIVRNIERLKKQIKDIDEELLNYSAQESEPELSSDSSDSEKKDPLSYMTSMSCSVMDYGNLRLTENNPMTQSFNEKLAEENAVLGEKYSSQEDIERISKVTSKNPIIDQNNIHHGQRTKESLIDLEEKRKLHLQKQGGIVIAEERRRLLALKQAAQNEVRSKWEQRVHDCSSIASTGSESTADSNNISEDPDKLKDSEGSSPSPDMSRSISDQLRADSEGLDSPRPLSESSEVSVDIPGTFNRRRVKQSDKQRPLTRYLPIRDSELDLRLHIESAGHQVVLCPHVWINATCCKGFLHKKASKLNTWAKRWFVFDRNKKALIYYTDKSEKKARGGAYFQTIEEVYLDHANSVKSPNPHLTFIIKTKQRTYYLMAPSPEAMRIWIDVVFTGAEGYQEFRPET